MEGPIFGISKDSILLAIEMLLTAWKNFFAWLGIIVLPDENEKWTDPSKDDPKVGA